MTVKKRAIEMQGRAELESLVRARTAELADLADYLDQAREDERRSLARALHDELGSIFTAARLDVAFIKSRCPASHPELIAKCDRIAAMLDQGAAFKRRIVDRLYPATLDLLGLAPALRELIEDVASAFHIAIAAEIDGDIVERDERALAIYRIVQSALGNVTRDGHATEVHVVLERAGDVLRVCVRDNGAALAPPGAARPGDRDAAAMCQRVEALEGAITMATVPGAGTRIEVRLPLRHR